MLKVGINVLVLPQFLILTLKDYNCVTALSLLSVNFLNGQWTVSFQHFDNVKQVIEGRLTCKKTRVAYQWPLCRSTCVSQCPQLRTGTSWSRVLLSTWPLWQYLACLVYGEDVRVLDGVSYTVFVLYPPSMVISLFHRFKWFAFWGTWPNFE